LTLAAQRLPTFPQLATLKGISIIQFAALIPYHHSVSVRAVRYSAAKKQAEAAVSIPQPISSRNSIEQFSKAQLIVQYQIIKALIANYTITLYGW
jgi:hypothetical protein